MIWIEMSRDMLHGGGEWGFSKCLWAPTYKDSDQKGSWLFWSNLLRVRQDDIIIHLQGKGHSAAFVGYSIAATDGHKTLEKPPKAGKWNYAKSFYRVLLRDYHEFDEPVALSDFFITYENELREYLVNLNVTPLNRFFVFQAGKLQCLNGAYLSECDNKLLEMILGKRSIDGASVRQTTATSETLHQIRQRIGQSQFSKAVKKNYHYRCCFPGCQISDPKFLIGSHIARWVDNPDKRGNTSNGLCFCPIHAKAFEYGYFSLDNMFRVVLNQTPEIQQSIVFCKYIKPYKNQKIALGKILPDTDALEEHRFRCGISV